MRDLHSEEVTILISEQYRKDCSCILTMFLHTMAVSSTRCYESASTACYYYQLANVTKAPLLLTLFSLIPPSLFSVATSLLFIAVDLGCANALMDIADARISGNERLFKSPRKELRWDSLAVGAAYV